jgi:hypothetical protein
MNKICGAADRAGYAEIADIRKLDRVMSAIKR